MYTNMRQTIQPISTTTTPHTIDKQKKNDILGLKHGSALGQGQKCGRVRFVNEIPTLPFSDLGSITFKCNRLHYNYFAIFMITLHYDYINFQI
jgi:hypothetical protein